MKAKKKKMKKVSDAKMGNKIPLELQVEELKKSMGTIVKALKDIQARVKVLEEKTTESPGDDIKELVNSQKVLKQIIEANSGAIKRLDAEIVSFKNDKAKADSTEIDENKVEKKGKKCKYFNGGHCKYKSECKFSHPKETCKLYLEGRKCDQKECNQRHPKVCKWSQRSSGCKRNDCDYLHVTRAGDDGKQTQAHKSYLCQGCKNCYEDKTCVVQNIVSHIPFYLCLNCDEWIKHKDKIMTPGWSLFNQNGDLRRDV